VKTRYILQTTLMAVVLGTAALSHAQALIYACVNSNNGALRIAAPGTTCGKRETLLTWPAAPTAPTTFYQRVSPTQPVFGSVFTTVIALCDAPADTAVGGGYQTDNLRPDTSTYNVAVNAPCDASGLCAGPAGEDGWIVMASSNAIAVENQRITAYVVCARQP
jgi:hypothetical protein